MTATVDQVIGVAASQIGYYRTPGTATKFGEWYGIPKGQWCQMFVSWCGVQAGAGDIIPKAAYTPSAANWYKSKGQWHSGIAGIRRGDEVYFDFPGAPYRISHTGLVESVNGDGSVNTIEGNTSGVSGGSERNGGLCARKRRKAYIVGYGRPAYASVPTPTPGKLVVDGSFGALTIKALQRSLRVAADGLFGPITKKALQRHLGVTADGSIGPLTIKALQRHLGVSQDGLWGPITTKALQIRLNAGAF